MKRSVFVFFFSLFIAGFSQAQTPLMVQGTTPKLYLQHAVAPRETWYSIGRLYNISPKELAPYNGLTMDKPLAIGQSLKIPLEAANFSQDGSKAADEVFVPVYHTVQEKEWMYRMSVNYNKVPFESLEKWNGLAHGAVLKPGMRMVVGYLKVKTGQSALAAKGSSKIAVATAPPPVVATTIPAADTKKPEIKEDKKAEPVATKTEPVVKNDPPAAAKTEAPKEQPVSQPPAQQNKPVVVNTPPAAAPDNKGGYFKSSYTEGYKSASGNAGVFKSTSGWNDGKYYALMNNVGVGSIVKVSTPSNGKAIYAKVLGSLPDMKESTGLTIRISDAAAAELGAGAATQKFGVDIKY